MALANYANQDGESWYSHAKIAADTEMGVSTVRKHVDKLIELGLVESEQRLRGNGSTSTNLYRLRLDRPGATTEQGGCHDVAGGVPRRSTPEPSVEPSVEPPVVQQALEVPVSTTHTAPSDETRSDPLLRFDEFWSVYPRKTAKGQARKAWPAAVRKATAENIIKGAIEYRDDPNREQQYTKHPATWLNGECWDDPALPARNGHQPERVNGYWPRDASASVTPSGSTYWPT
jgi:DNA-binding transcriptional MocR family regulator